MKILSPAKINLMLRILGQRDDGYHLLQTYFQLLDWGDEMVFEQVVEDTIEISGNFNKLPQENNLIYKVAMLLKPYRQIDDGIKIHVEKKIPQGSGLGGGSSNAGTTLRVLNKMWQCHLTQEQLQKMALTLGADVPIFVFNHSAMALGVGENLTPLTIDNYYYVLIFPPVGISTVAVFSEPKLIRNQKAMDARLINQKKYWHNACLAPVLKKYPIVNDYYQRASKYSTIYMSGTGSTLFAAFKNKQEALEFIAHCPSKWHTQLCHSK